MSLPAALSLLGGLIAAGLGGWAFSLLGVPLAWILGAMTGSALFTNLVGMAGNTKYVRRSGQLLVGAATGAVLSPEILRTLLDLLPAMAVAALAANFAGVLLAFPLAKIAGVDRTTALLSTLPAGMAEMASLAQDINARPDVVTVVHTLRVVLVVVSIPLFFGIAGVARPPAEAAEGATMGALFACIAIGAALSFLAARIGLLNPWVIMPMTTGILLVALGFPLAIMPTPLLVAAQIFIGFSLGTRLRSRDLAKVPRAVAASLICGGALIAIMVFVVVPLLRLWIDVDAATLALGVAPGGLGEMIASAKALGAASAVVAGFQFVRSFLTNMIAPPLILRLTGHPTAKAPTDEDR